MEHDLPSLFGRAKEQDRLVKWERDVDERLVALRPFRAFGTSDVKQATSSRDRGVADFLSTQHVLHQPETHQRWMQNVSQSPELSELPGGDN